jgi:hypothetical protein
MANDTPDELWLNPAVAILPALLIARKTGPCVIWVSVSQVCTASATQLGIGTGSSVPSLCDEIGEDPLFALLDVIDLYRR